MSNDKPEGQGEATALKTTITWDDGTIDAITVFGTSFDLFKLRTLLEKRLRTELAPEAVHPVAWRFRFKDDESPLNTWTVYGARSEDDMERPKLNEALMELEPLYTAPPEVSRPPAPSEAKPVAWVHLEKWLSDKYWPDDCFTAYASDGLAPLFAHPPKAPEVPSEAVWREEFVGLLERVAFIRRALMEPDIHFESVRDLQREMNAILEPYESYPIAAIKPTDERDDKAPEAPSAARTGSPPQHVGNSNFEGWFESKNMAHLGTKQLCRDAYAAGMSDGACTGIASEAGALAKFTDYFVKNYPGPDTIIHDPHWHAPKIFRAARAALRVPDNKEEAP